MPQKMKALVKKFSKPGIWMDEVPVPDIGINDPNDKDEVGNGSGSVFPTDPPPVISGSMVARQDRRPRDWRSLF